MNIQYFNTNRLFYKKWIYKVECWEIDAFYLLKPSSRKHFPNFTKGLAEEYGSWRDDIIQNYDVKIRREGPYYLSFYLNDESLLEKMIQSGPWIRKVVRPKNQQETQMLMDSPCAVRLCNRYHRGKYRYKIYLSNKMNVTTRSQFLKWADAYPDQKVLASNTTLFWLMGERHRYLDSPYIHVLDDSTLAMAGLFLGNNIKKIEQYVLRSTINIQSTPPEETANGGI